MHARGSTEYNSSPVLYPRVYGLRKLIGGCVNGWSEVSNKSSWHCEWLKSSCWAIESAFRLASALLSSSSPCTQCELRRLCARSQRGLNSVIGRLYMHAVCAEHLGLSDCLSVCRRAVSHRHWRLSYSQCSHRRSLVDWLHADCGNQAHFARTWYLQLN